MTLSQKPDPISLVGNLKKFILTDCEKNTSLPFILSCNNEELVNEWYVPDSNNKITVNVQDIVDGQLSVNIPPFDELIADQNNSVKTFVAKIDNTTVEFVVVKGGVLDISESCSDFLKYNFLTWQPQAKNIILRQPEWLSYYAAENVTVCIKGYFTDETTDIYSISIEAGKVYTLNMNYDVVNGYFEKEISYYDVYIIDSQNNRLTYIQRYIPTRDYDNSEIYIFENSIGGVDSFVCTGERIKNINTKGVLTSVEEKTNDGNINYSLSYEQNTGFLRSTEESIWLHDFFISKQRFHATDVLREIYIEEQENKYSTTELNSYTFKYNYSKQTIYNNVVRNRESLPQLLEFPSPDGLFFLTPRLSEYPISAYGDDLMIPVQVPYSEKWKRISAKEVIGGVGGILNKDYWSKKELVNTDLYLSILGEKIKAGFADDSERWAGELFKDYLDQSVRITDDVRFQNIIVELLLRAKGIVAESFSTPEFVSGMLGSGSRLKGDHLELGEITVRKRMNVRELMIEMAKSIGGTLIVSAGAMKTTTVEDGGSYFKCLFDNDGGAIENPFVVDDQVLCQTFTGEKIKRYWRRVTSCGTDYFNLSKADCETGSADPEAGDEVVQLGNRTDVTRQSASILCAVGADAPYYDNYSGINSFDLTGKLVTREGNLAGIVDEVFGQLSDSGLYGKNVYLRGRLALASGKTVDTALGEVDAKSENAKSTAESAKELAANASSEVSKTNAELTKVTRDVQVLADAQTGFSVSVSEVREKVDNLQIGGVNIYVDKLGSSDFTIASVPGAGYTTRQFLDFSAENKKRLRGKYLTVSFDYELVEAKLLGVAGFEFVIKYTDGSITPVTASVKGIYPEKTSASGRYAKTIKLENKEIDGSTSWQPYMFINTSEGVAKVGRPAFYIGEKDLGWQENPDLLKKQTEAIAEAKANLAIEQANAYADGIVTEAEQAAIDEAQRRLDALQIGGVNIVSGTGTFVGGDIRPSYNGYGIVQTELFNGNVVYQNTIDFQGLYFQCSPTIEPTIVSFYAKKISGSPIFASFIDRSNPGIANANIESSEWKQYYLYFKNGTNFSNTVRNGVLEFYFGIVQYSSPKVELATKPSAWSPSLADQKAEANHGKLFLRGTGLNNHADRQFIINNNGVNLASAGTGLQLITIRRSDLAIIDNIIYDTYTYYEHVNLLVDKLNSLSQAVIVTLTSFDTVTIAQRDYTQLINAISRCGGSGSMPGVRVPYAFIGIPGIGKGNGIEVMTTAEATAPYAEISTQIINGIPSGMSNATSFLAKQAKEQAEAAQNKLSDWASDKKISPVEKPGLKQQLADINAEYAEININAINLNLKHLQVWLDYNSAYVSAIDTLVKYTAASPESIDVAADYARIANYYPFRQKILSGISLSSTNTKRITRIDATGLDQNTYYPVTMEIYYGQRSSFQVKTSLNVSGVPAWANHPSGFSCECSWSANGHGYGTIPVNRYINSFIYSWASVLPIGDIDQMSNSSNEYIYVRGGGVYTFTTTNVATPVLRISDFTYNNQTISPKSSVSAPEVDVDAVRTELTTAINAKPDRVELTALETKYNALGERVSTAEGRITTMAGDISLFVKKNDLISEINLLPEGIRINANKIEITGATVFKDGGGNVVNIFGSGTDVFNINNAFKVDKYGKATMRGAEVEGKVTATSGKIGGFSIDGHIITNKNGNNYNTDASIIFRNDPVGVFASFGANTLASSTGMRALMRLENDDASVGYVKNYGAIINASGSRDLHGNIAILVERGIIEAKGGIDARPRVLDKDLYNNTLLEISNPNDYDYMSIFPVNSECFLTLSKNTHYGKIMIVSNRSNVYKLHLENMILNRTRVSLIGGASAVLVYMGSSSSGGNYGWLIAGYYDNDF